MSMNESEYCIFVVNKKNSNSLGKVEVIANLYNKVSNIIVDVYTIITRVVDDHKYIYKRSNSTWIIEICKL